MVLTVQSVTHRESNTGLSLKGDFGPYLQTGHAQYQRLLVDFRIEISEFHVVSLTSSPPCTFIII